MNAIADASVVSVATAVAVATAMKYTFDTLAKGSNICNSSVDIRIYLCITSHNERNPVRKYS